MIIDFDGSYIDLSCRPGEVLVKTPIRLAWERENLQSSVIRGQEGVWYIGPEDTRKIGSVLTPEQVNEEESWALYQLVPAVADGPYHVVQHRYLIRYWKAEGLPLMQETVITLNHQDNDWKIHGVEGLRLVGVPFRQPI